MKWIKGTYLLTDQKSSLDDKIVYDLLKEQHWAKNRTFKQMKNSFKHSICFGLYTKNHQIGFARVVTDYATFSWLCDVVIDKDYRGKGLGKWMVESIISYPSIEKTRFFLRTQDAHGLYEKYNFKVIEAMIRRPEE